MIYFVRHGESEDNVKKLFAGRKDSLLTEKGREQARKTAKNIRERELNVDRIISSPLKRALETAEIIAREIGFDKNRIEISDEIIEYDMGSITGTPWGVISSKILIGAENAEDPEIFKNRVYNFVKELSKSDKNILLVSHAGIIRMLETIKIKGDPELFYDISQPPNASIIEIDWI
ncbi:MAG: histidine phosphatase family protein [Candidatus Paceibacterota bacterium]|jgi:probable phosphoglycerate mutase